MSHRRFAIRYSEGECVWMVLDRRTKAVAAAHGMSLRRLTLDDAIEWMTLLNFWDALLRQAALAGPAGQRIGAAPHGAVRVAG